MVAIGALALFAFTNKNSAQKPPIPQNTGEQASQQPATANPNTDTGIPNTENGSVAQQDVTQPAINPVQIIDTVVTPVTNGSNTNVNPVEIIDTVVDPVSSPAPPIEPSDPPKKDGGAEAVALQGVIYTRGNNQNITIHVVPEAQQNANLYSANRLRYQNGAPYSY